MAICSKMRAARCSLGLGRHLPEATSSAGALWALCPQVGYVSGNLESSRPPAYKLPLASRAPRMTLKRTSSAGLLHALSAFTHRRRCPSGQMQPRSKTQLLLQGMPGLLRTAG